jgi:hypothetical protein
MLVSRPVVASMVTVVVRFAGTPGATMVLTRPLT